MTYRIVVIDDLRVPAESEELSIEVYRTPEEGLAVLQEASEIGELWLDHDMGWDVLNSKEVTIWPVVDWLEQEAHEGRVLDIQYIFVHTSNPVGATRIIAALSPFYRVARAELPTKGAS